MQAVCDLGREDRFAFDPEHLLIAKSIPGGVEEAGVVREHRDGGMVRQVRDGLAMLRSAARLRLRGRERGGEGPGRRGGSGLCRLSWAAVLGIGRDGSRRSPAQG